VQVTRAGQARIWGTTGHTRRGLSHRARFLARSRWSAEDRGKHIRVPVGKTAAYMARYGRLQKRLRRMHAIRAASGTAGRCPKSAAITGCVPELSLRLTKARAGLALSSETIFGKPDGRLCGRRAGHLELKGAAGHFNSDGEPDVRFGAAGYEDEAKKQASRNESEISALLERCDRVRRAASSQP